MLAPSDKSCLVRITPRLFRFSGFYETSMMSEANCICGRLKSARFLAAMLAFVNRLKLHCMFGFAL